MARGVPGFVRIGAALAGCALVSACTPEPGPTQTPAPTSAAPPGSTTPTPSATPIDTEIERQQRLDFEAAEKAYRAGVKEVGRLARRGESKASPALNRVAGGDYLAITVSSLSAIKARRQRFVGKVSIISVGRVGGWSAEQLTLLGCEDNSTWSIYDPEGKNVTPAGQPDYVQTLTIEPSDGEWKVVAVSSKKVQQVSAVDCGSP